jgi:uncharacterized protein YuzE
MTKVKRELSYRASFNPDLTSIDESELNFIISAIIEYDEKGNILKNETFDDEGHLVQVVENAYDMENRLIAERQYFAEDEVEEKREITYTPEGKIMTEKRVYPYDSYDLVNYTYNSGGNVIKKEIRDEEGEAGELTVYEYEGEHLIKETSYDEEGNMTENIEIEYNEKGQAVVRHEYRPMDKVPFRFDFAYDEYGNRNMVKRYNSSGKMLEKVSFVYDEEGHIRRMKEETPTYTRIHDYHFDESGHNYEDIVTDLAGNISSRIVRFFNPEGLQTRSEVRLHQMGRTVSYVLKIDYELHPE